MPKRKRKPDSKRVARRVDLRLSDTFSDRLAIAEAAHELPASAVLRMLISREWRRLAEGAKP